MSEPFLQIEDLSYQVDGHMLLDNINYVGSGADCVALLGANGAGKSTLLDICYGLTRPSRGRVKWFGREPDAARDDLALVLQKPVFLDRSVSANLKFVLRQHGLHRRRHAERIEQTLARVGLADKADLSAHYLSGGEQKCLSIARACLFAPRALLLDEPTAQLDYPASVRVERLIMGMKNEGIKIILTSHNPAQVKRLCDEVVFLDHGRSVVCATSEQFFGRTPHPAVRDFIKLQSLA